MSKIAALEKQANRLSQPVASAAAPASIPEVTETARPKSTQAPSRDGKANISAFMHPAYKSSLRMVQAKAGGSITDLLEEALNDLFEKHKVPRVDK